ncbi:SIRBL protein, partial [Crotophaga sulcirostris]|nr:SIRBL protein [Crotophaga sulcirostris]
DAQVGQDFKLWQSQGPVSVAAGQTLTLNCTIFGDNINGPVKWLKSRDSGNGPGNEQVVYADAGTFPRVTRAVTKSNTDFTIHIRDVQPEDAGTYYCVKFRKKVPDEEEFQRGKGTEVSVHEPALLPSMVAAAVVLCFLLLLGLLVAFYLYRRKRLAGPAAAGSSSPIALRCCAGTPSTPRFVPTTSSFYFSGANIHHLCAPLQQSSKDDNEIHYADLQPLPTAPRHGRSPDAATSEYASIKVAAR